MFATLGKSKQILKAVMLAVLVAVFALPEIHFHDHRAYDTDQAYVTDHAIGHTLLPYEHSQDADDAAHHRHKDTNLYIDLPDSLIEEIWSLDDNPSSLVLIVPFTELVQTAQNIRPMNSWPAPPDMGILPERKFILGRTKLSPPAKHTVA